MAAARALPVCKPCPALLAAATGVSWPLVLHPGRPAVAPEITDLLRSFLPDVDAWTALEALDLSVKTGLGARGRVGKHRPDLVVRSADGVVYRIDCKNNPEFYLIVDTRMRAAKGRCGDIDSDSSAKPIWRSTVWSSQRADFQVTIRRTSTVVVHGVRMRQQVIRIDDGNNPQFWLEFVV